MGIIVSESKKYVVYVSFKEIYFVMSREKQQAYGSYLIVLNFLSLH